MITLWFYVSTLVQNVPNSLPMSRPTCSYTELCLDIFFSSLLMSHAFTILRLSWTFPNERHVSAILQNRASSLLGSGNCWSLGLEWLWAVSLVLWPSWERITVPLDGVIRSYTVRGHTEVEPGKVSSQVRSRDMSRCRSLWKEPRAYRACTEEESKR